MKRLILLFLIACLPVFSTSAFSYEIQVLRNIPLTDNLTGISISPATNLAASVSRDTKILYLIDVPSGSITQKVPLDVIPSGVVIDDKRNIAIISSSEGMLHFIDLETGGVIKMVSIKGHSELVSESTNIHSIAINPQNDLLYIGNSNSLMVLDLNTENIIKEASISNPVIDMDIDSNLGYLALVLSSGIVHLYNSETLEPITEISTGKNPSAVAVNPSTHIAVLTNNLDNSISILSLEAKALLDTILFNEQPNALTVDSVSNTALITRKGGITIVKLENPIPQINALIPESSRAGDPAFTLSIKGEKFIQDSKARFDTKELITRFLDNFSLQADVPSSELQMPGDVPVSVINPSPGGGQSNTLTFSIYNPIPVLEYISPDTILLTPNNELRTLNSELVTAFRVYGKNFMPLSIINLNGNNLKTKFISSILLEAEINSTVIQSSGKYPVVVINPSPGAYTSNPLYLNVVEDVTRLETQDLRLQTQDSRLLTQEPQKQTGTLRGRILNTKKEPIEGVTVKIKNISTQTDSNGYFTLGNVPAGKRHLMIRGMTAKDINSRYPTIPLTVNIQADMINEMPFQIYLHRQKNRNFKNINPNEDTILTDPEVPGFEMRIPKGVNITGWDGNTNKKISVRTVPIDRLPIKPLPQNANVRTVYMFYFNKEGGGIPDQPIPIKSKNDLGLLPGEKAVLWYYDESPNEGEAPNDWAIAGTGTVTPNGKYIVSDSGVGIPKFCCGATAWGGESASLEKSGDNGDCGLVSDPVDVSTGYFMHEKTDLHVPGIIPINITRYYRSRDSGSAVTASTGLGAFGKGMYLEYDWWLGAYDASGNINDTNPTMYLLIKPGNYQYRFDVQQTGGTFINDSDPAMSGAVITKNADNTKTLKMRDGWTYKFDSSGDLIEIADRNGNKLTLERWDDFYGGYLKKITTQEGRTVTFNQTNIGIFRTDSIVDDTTGRTITYTYEGDPFSSYPRLKTVTYPDRGSIEYQYDSSGRLYSIKNERGILEVLNEYYDDEASGKKNRIYKQTHADGGTYIFDYTIAGGNITETTMTTPNGAQTTWGFYDYATRSIYYDKYIAYMITPDGTTVYEREAGTNLLLSVIDPLNRKMTYTYYPNGQTETLTDNLGNITRYEYESIYGLPSKITDANLKDTTFTYTYGADNKITKTEIRDPLLKLTTIDYNSYGMPTSIIDPNLNTTTFLYENAGKPAELTKIIAPSPINSTTTMTYDSLGRLWTVIDANNKTTTYTYNEMDKIVEIKDPIGNTTRYSYGKTGNLLSVTDAKNQTIRYEYDERDRIKKMTDQLGRIETYAYYTGAEITLLTGDNLKSITDRKNQVTTFNEYDSMNRVKKITYNDGSFTDYTYDLAGRIDYINDSVSGFIDYTYNDFGCTTCGGRGMDRIAQEVTPLGTIDYAYDNIGRRKTMQVTGQPVVNYDYYDNGWLENVRQIISGTEQKFNFVYDNGGRRERLKYFKGIDLITQTTYGFDNASRLLEMKHLNSLSQILEQVNYGYDPNGNRTSMNRPSVNLPTPNSVSNTSYNEANQMLSFNDKNITYDNNGNMTSVTNTCGTANYTWNARNQLVTINGFNTDCSSLTASFKYDALNRRIEKTINGVTTQYLYDGVDIIQEKQNSVVTANYIRGLNIDEPLARIKADGTIRNYLADSLGSIIALTDENGVVKTTYSYDPFGNVTLSGEASDNPFQYAGRENDETGNLFERNRYYNFELMRYISQDPIGFAGGDVNYYVRVGNNPVNFVDPWGLLTSEEWNRLLNEIKGWIETPYNKLGKKSKKRVGADCSGSVYGIYNNAKFPTDYYMAKDFPLNPDFELVDDGVPQPGDVAVWRGHLAIYDPNAEYGGKKGNVWTARDYGKPYGVGEIKWYNKIYGPVQWYRYNPK